MITFKHFSPLNILPTCGEKIGRPMMAFANNMDLDETQQIMDIGSQLYDTQNANLSFLCFLQTTCCEHSLESNRKVSFNNGHITCG